jgi:hypothetical protein
MKTFTYICFVGKEMDTYGKNACIQAESEIPAIVKMTLGTTPHMSHSFDGSTTSTAVVYIHESTINKQREREREREREDTERQNTSLPRRWHLQKRLRAMRTPQLA